MRKDDCVRRLRLYPSDCVAVLLAHREARHHAACELGLKLADDAGNCVRSGSIFVLLRWKSSVPAACFRIRPSSFLLGASHLCAPVRLAAQTGQSASASVAPTWPLSLVLDSRVHSVLHGHRPCAARAADNQEWRGSETGSSLVSELGGHRPGFCTTSVPVLFQRDLWPVNHIVVGTLPQGAVSLQDETGRSGCGIHAHSLCCFSAVITA